MQKKAENAVKNKVKLQQDKEKKTMDMINKRKAAIIERIKEKEFKLLQKSMGKQVLQYFSLLKIMNAIKRTSMYLKKVKESKNVKQLVEDNFHLIQSWKTAKKTQKLNKLSLTLQKIKKPLMKVVASKSIIHHFAQITLKNKISFPLWNMIKATNRIQTFFQFKIKIKFMQRAYLLHQWNKYLSASHRADNKPFKFENGVMNILNSIFKEFRKQSLLLKSIFDSYKVNKQSITHIENLYASQIDKMYFKVKDFYQNSHSSNDKTHYKHKNLFDRLLFITCKLVLPLSQDRRCIMVRFMGVNYQKNMSYFTPLFEYKTKKRLSIILYESVKKKQTIHRVEYLENIEDFTVRQKDKIDNYRSQ